MWTFRTDPYTFPQYDAVGIRRFAPRADDGVRQYTNHPQYAPRPPRHKSLRKQSSPIEFLFSVLISSCKGLGMITRRSFVGVLSAVPFAKLFGLSTKVRGVLRVGIAG